MIGKEDGNIPLLARINEKGFVREVDDTKLVIDLYGKAITVSSKVSITIYHSPPPSV
jgi:hypothetical protein